MDWALIAAWREAGIPLAAVLQGIDQAFEKFATGRRHDHARLRSLLYCAPAVLDAAEALRASSLGAAPDAGDAAAQRATEAGFAPDRILAHLRAAHAALATSSAVPPAIPEALARLMADLEGGAPPAPEALDRTLTVLDDQLFAALQQATPVEVMVALRAALEGDLAPYRRQLRPEQIAMIARQFEQRRLLEHHRLPRLSLFYMA